MTDPFGSHSEHYFGRIYCAIVLTTPERRKTISLENVALKRKRSTMTKHKKRSICALAMAIEDACSIVRDVVHRTSNTDDIFYEEEAASGS
jgi:hypothetical protein